MGDKLPEPHASSSPAVAASSEAEEIEVLDSEDVLPMAAEDVSFLCSVASTRTRLIGSSYLYLECGLGGEWGW